jgi:hypothetical protein
MGITRKKQMGEIAMKILPTDDVVDLANMLKNFIANIQKP